MKTIFIGVDISKNQLDYSICVEPTQKSLESKRVDNTIEGIQSMIEDCGTYGSSLWYCFEHTGNYGLLLANQLQNDGLTYSIVPALEIKQSSGMIRGKNDKVDSKRIAMYAATSAHKLNPTILPDHQLIKIKALLAYRSQYVRISRQLQNHKKSLEITLQIEDVKDILDDIQSQILQIKTKIEDIETKIKKQIKSEKTLNTNFQKITSVKGIGPIISFYMLVYTNNFQNFSDPRKFNCYAGLAPFEYRSGTSINYKTKTNRLRNKVMKALIFNGANSAVRCDYELKAYYKRKKLEGKNHNVVINAVACKLVARMFAVVKRDEPFVNLVR